MSSLSLITEKLSIAIANIDNSNPFNGRRVRTAALKPKIVSRTDNKPIPQTLQPGTRMPKNTPIVPKNPAFLLNLIPDLIL